MFIFELRNCPALLFCRTPLGTGRRRFCGLFAFGQSRRQVLIQVSRFARGSTLCAKGQDPGNANPAAGIDGKHITNLHSRRRLGAVFPIDAHIAIANRARRKGSAFEETCEPEIFVDSRHDYFLNLSIASAANGESGSTTNGFSGRFCGGLG